MIKALLLVFSPVPTWNRITTDQPRAAAILLFHTLPLLVLVGIAEGYGLVRWGRWQKDGILIKHFGIPETVVFQVFQLLLAMGTVLLGAKLIKALGETFHGRHTYAQALTLSAFGLSPLFAINIFNMFPAISPWLTWLVGFALAAGVLYHGIPPVMQPDPPHAFGLYLTSTLLLFVITGMVRFFTAWYLQGRFKPLENVISDIVTRLTS